jgi:hypothetical protein
LKLKKELEQKSEECGTKQKFVWEKVKINLTVYLFINIILILHRYR